MNKEKEVVNIKYILAYFVDTIRIYLNENIKAELIRKSKFNEDSAVRIIYIYIYLSFLFLYFI